MYFKGCPRFPKLAKHIGKTWGLHCLAGGLSVRFWAKAPDRLRGFRVIQVDPYSSRYCVELPHNLFGWSFYYSGRSLGFDMFWLIKNISQLGMFPNFFVCSANQTCLKPRKSVCFFVETSCNKTSPKPTWRAGRPTSFRFCLVRPEWWNNFKCQLPTLKTPNVRQLLFMPDNRWVLTQKYGENPQNGWFIEKTLWKFMI